MIWLTVSMVVGSSLGFALGTPFVGLAVGTAVGGLLAWLIGRRSDREQ
jgi:ABC-type uncharacterized transport system permease subunit